MGTAEVCTTSAPSLANVASITYDLSKEQARSVYSDICFQVS